jgi:hypothetical protein
MLYRHILLLFVMAAICGLTGCAAKAFEDPIPVMGDRRHPLDVRQSAAAQAKERFGDSPRYAEALHRLVWDRGHPTVLRKYAVDELVRIDPEAFRAVLARRIILLDDWDTVSHVLDVVLARQWHDMTAPIVRHYARPVQGINDQDRVERAALRKLHPNRSVEQVVFEVFIDGSQSTSYIEQVAAWELLVRISAPDELMQLLASAPDVTPLIVDLKAGARDLSVLPLNREGALWLAHLRSPPQRGFYEAAMSAVARLSPHQRQGLELRHLPVVLLLDSATLAQDRQALYQRLQDELQRREHHTTGPRFDGPMHDYPQYLQHWNNELVWADLAGMLLILEALQQRQVVAQLFAQADEDLADTSTEYGGVLRHEGGRYVAELHKPTVRHHDRKFIPTDRMIERMYTSVAHYHFHAQKYGNSSFAGPGRGDLDLAGRLNFNGLVFTFINRNKINVDFYRSRGIIVDLGVIER